jgi:hypothetical protein
MRADRAGLTMAHEERIDVTAARSGTAGASEEGGEPVEFPLVLGLDTFGDRTNDQDGRPDSHAQTIRNVVFTSSGVLA